jgi:hypothetical protein
MPFSMWTYTCPFLTNGANLHISIILSGMRETGWKAHIGKVLWLRWSAKVEVLEVDGDKATTILVGDNAVDKDLDGAEVSCLGAGVVVIVDAITLKKWGNSRLQHCEHIMLL